MLRLRLARPATTTFAIGAALLLAACGGEAGSDGEDGDGDSASTSAKPDLASVDDCPITGGEFRGTTETVHCKCTAFKVGAGVVFGSGPYLDDSSICRAAAHAGLIAAEGGEDTVVSVTPMPGADLEFKASEANGITTSELISSSPAKGAYTVE